MFELDKLQIRVLAVVFDACLLATFSGQVETYYSTWNIKSQGHHHSIIPSCIAQFKGFL